MLDPTTHALYDDACNKGTLLRTDNARANHHNCATDGWPFVLSSPSASGVAEPTGILCLVEKSASTVFKLLAFKAMGVARFPDDDGVYRLSPHTWLALPTANSWRQAAAPGVVANGNA